MERVKISQVASIVRGVSYKKDQASKSKALGTTLLLRANNINAGQFNYDDLIYVPVTLVSEEQYIMSGDIVITMSSGSKAHVGKVALSRKDMNCTFGAFCAKIIPQDIYPAYLFYFLMSSIFRSHIEAQSKGTNINNLKQSNIMDFEIPCPPLSEQHRIVSRIEELFSELDNSVATLQKTKEQLKVYRQAVLKEAFDCIDANTVSIQDECENIVDCPHSTPKWTNKGFLCLRTTNFRRGYLDLSEPNYVSKDTFDKRNQRLVPLPGDVLYSREGAILGLACIIPSETYVCLGQRMMLLRTGSGLSNKYLMHFLNSPKLNNFVASVTGGSASPHVNVGDIKKFQIPFPDIEEQHRVVKFIESRLSVCDDIEHTVDTALLQAEAMRQSILKQAFEGRL